MSADEFEELGRFDCADQLVLTLTRQRREAFRLWEHFQPLLLYFRYSRPVCCSLAGLEGREGAVDEEDHPCLGRARTIAGRDDLSGNRGHVFRRLQVQRCEAGLASGCYRVMRVLLCRGYLLPRD